MSSSQRRRRIAGGFSLLEVMVVLVIIGLIVGLITVNVIGQLKGAKRDTAAAQMAEIVSALDIYYLENGKYPSSDEGLSALTAKSEKTGEPLMRAIPRDPWGNAFLYNSPGFNGEPFEVVTYGADGREGGDGADADLVNWDLEKGDESANG